MRLPPGRNTFVRCVLATKMTIPREGRIYLINCLNSATLSGPSDGQEYRAKTSRCW